VNPAARHAVRAVTGILPTVGSAVAEHLWFRPRGRRGTGPPAGTERFEVRVAGRRLEGFTHGAGDITLLVHGWGGVANDMAPLASAVADSGRRAVVVDLPGHGSDRGGRTDIFEMASALHAVAALHGPPNAVVAHSFGAPATITAFPYGGPDRVVLIAPAFPGTGFVSAFAGHLGLSERAGARFLRRFEDYAGPHVLSVVHGEATVPGAEMLVLHDPADRRTAFGESQRFVERHPGARLVPVPGAGHQGILRSGETSAWVVRFLSEGMAAVTPEDRPDRAMTPGG
jgi:hypothetical protein